MLTHCYMIYWLEWTELEGFFRRPVEGAQRFNIAHGTSRWKAIGFLVCRLAGFTL